VLCALLLGDDPDDASGVFAIRVEARKVLEMVDIFAYD
jgi:hypothetical protein